jgi:hypothetical protein
MLPLALEVRTMSGDSNAALNLVELASGVDAMYLSGRTTIPLWVERGLEGARKHAEKVGGPEPIWLGHTQFEVAPRSFGRYRYCLVHENGRVGVTASTVLPALRIQPRAEFLHGVGAKAAAQWFEAQLESVCGAIELSVTRLDLHADFQGWDLVGEDRHRFVCRARSRTLYEEEESFTGFTFGKRRTHTVSARIYDKTVEMRRSRAGYWVDIWGRDYDPERPVIRVEFEFGSQGLAEFGIRSPEQAVDAAGGLWSHATTDWLSLRLPGSDATRSRWPVAPEWEQVRRARLSDDAHGLERMHEGRRLATIEGITPALVGYLVSYGALNRTTGIDDTSALVPFLLRSFEHKKHTSIERRLAERGRELDVQ